MPLGSPPIHQLTQAHLKWYLSLESEQALSFLCRRQTTWYRIHGPLGRKLWNQPGPAHHHSERVCQLCKACLAATCDVEHFIADIRLSTQDIGARDITHVHEI